MAFSIDCLVLQKQQVRSFLGWGIEMICTSESFCVVLFVVLCDVFFCYSFSCLFPLRVFLTVSLGRSFAKPVSVPIRLRRSKEGSFRTGERDYLSSIEVECPVPLTYWGTCQSFELWILGFAEFVHCCKLLVHHWTQDGLLSLLVSAVYYLYFVFSALPSVTCFVIVNCWKR